MSVLEHVPRLNDAIRSNDWVAGLEIASRILDEDPTFFKALEARALALSQLGKLPDAIAASGRTIEVLEERRRLGLEVEELLGAAYFQRGRDHARGGMIAESIADLRSATALDRSYVARAKRDASWKEAMTSPAFAELAKRPTIRRHGVLLEFSCVAGGARRNEIFALGSVNEVIQVLVSEFSCSSSARDPDAAQRISLAAYLAISCAEVISVHPVRAGKAGAPTDLHPFIEVCWQEVWHRLSARDDLKPLALLLNNTPRTGEALRFRIQETELRAAFSAPKGAALKDTECLQVDGYEDFSGTEAPLQHGRHDLENGEFTKLDDVLVL